MRTPTSPKPSARASSPGFSLVEVVLALGIVTFCLVALVGLLAVSMKASRESIAATADSLLFQKVINQLRVASTNRELPQTGQKGDAERLPLPAAGDEGTITFTVDHLNRYLDTGVVTNTPEASRVVTVRITTPRVFEEAGGIAPIDLSSKGSLALVRVTVEPAQGHANRKTSNVFSTELNLALQ